MLEKITIEEANTLMIKTIKTITEVEEVAIEQAIGRILAKDMVAPIQQPPFPRSPVDGYACLATDTKGAKRKHPVKLTVVGEICAGEAYDGVLQKGQALRIMTGAPIPDGCTCCIRQEDTNGSDAIVHVYQEMEAYQNYCYAGEDFKRGDTLLKANTKIGYIELGVLASIGKTTVSVYRQVKVALITSGDELLLPNERLTPGKIYNSNRYLLLGRMLEFKIMPTFIQHVEDDDEVMVKTLQNVAKEVDIIITTGGVSVGKKDIFHTALVKAGARKLFWKVQVKPGSPTIFSILEGVPIVSLSGNPFGALVNFEMLVRPMLYALTNDANFSLQKKKCTLADDFDKVSKTRRIIRARYLDKKIYLPSKQDSGVLSSAVGCHCLLDIPAGSEKLKKGELVTVWML